MDRWITDGRIDRQLDRQAAEQTDVQAHRQTARHLLVDSN